MFRNDPLESLKVSSTFDSIPFVREYLQKEIEGQLRTLLMDEVPAIIHRLSLRLWVPEHRVREDEELAGNNENPLSSEKAIDPLASPPEDPVDLSGHILDASQIASLSLDSGAETHSLFSQKNLVRLGALTNSQRTLSLFTPNIRDAVFRAWAGPTERGELFGGNPQATPTLSRAHSYSGSTSTTYIFSDGAEGGLHAVRPTLSSFGSAAIGLSLGSSKHGKQHGGRKRKHRIVNLRKKGPTNDELESVSGEGSTASGTISSAPSEYGLPSRPAEREGELVTPPTSPEKPWVRRDFNSIDLDDTSPRLRNLTPRKTVRAAAEDLTPKASMHRPTAAETSSSASAPNTLGGLTLQAGPSIPIHQSSTYQTPHQPSQPTLSTPYAYHPDRTPIYPSYLDSAPQAGTFEQAWVMRMAGEIARRVHDEKVADSGFWDRREREREETPPPAYGP